jgi:hypothetical protein
MIYDDLADVIQNVIARSPLHYEGDEAIFTMIKQNNCAKNNDLTLSCERSLRCARDDNQDTGSLFSFY